MNQVFGLPVEIYVSYIKRNTSLKKNYWSKHFYFFIGYTEILNKTKQILVDLLKFYSLQFTNFSLVQ